MQNKKRKFQANIFDADECRTFSTKYKQANVNSILKKSYPVAEWDCPQDARMVYTNSFYSSQITIAKSWKRPVCLAMNEWINKVW